MDPITFNSSDILRKLDEIELIQRDDNPVPIKNTEEVIKWLGERLDINITPEILKDAKKRTYLGRKGTMKIYLDPRIKANWIFYGFLPIPIGLYFLSGQDPSMLRSVVMDEIYFIWAWPIAKYLFNRSSFVTGKIVSLHRNLNEARGLENAAHEYTHFLQRPLRLKTDVNKESSEGIAEYMGLQFSEACGYHNHFKSRLKYDLGLAFASYELKEGLADSDISQQLSERGLNGDGFVRRAKAIGSQKKSFPYVSGLAKVLLLEDEYGAEGPKAAFNNGLRNLIYHEFS
jgi:hypothetical protein